MRLRQATQGSGDKIETIRAQAAPEHLILASPAPDKLIRPMDRPPHLNPLADTGELHSRKAEQHAGVAVGRPLLGMKQRQVEQ